MTGKLEQWNNGVWLEDGRAITFNRATKILEHAKVQEFVRDSETLLVGNAVYAEDRSTVKVHLTADWERTLCGIETDNISMPINLGVTCKSCAERFRRYAS